MTSLHDLMKGQTGIGRTLPKSFGFPAGLASVMENARIAQDIQRSFDHSRILRESHVALMSRMNELMKPITSMFANHNSIDVMSGHMAGAVSSAIRMEALTRSLTKALDNRLIMTQSLAGSSILGLLDRVGAATHQSTSIFSEYQAQLEKIQKSVAGPLESIGFANDIIGSALAALHETQATSEIRSSIAKSLHTYDAFDSVARLTAGRQYLFDLLRATDIDRVSSLAEDDELLQDTALVDDPDDLTVQIQAAVTGDGTISDKLNRLIELATNSNQTTRRQVLIGLLTSFLFWVLQQVVEAIWDGVSNVRSSDVVRTVRESVSEEAADNIDLQEHRIVSRDVLWVRDGRRTSSSIIGVVRAGDIVLVIEKRTKWRRIRWFDSTAEEFRLGWVLSKYLKSF